jgi:hypothetical protein
LPQYFYFPRLIGSAGSRTLVDGSSLGFKAALKSMKSNESLVRLEFLEEGDIGESLCENFRVCKGWPTFTLDSMCYQIDRAEAL